MKKTLTLFMILALLLSCFAGLSFSTSAAEVEFVEEIYDYEAASRDDYGNIDGLELNPETETYDSPEGFFLGDVWTYEYYTISTKEFKPMTSFIKNAIDGYTPKYANTYVPFGEAGYSENIYTYNMITKKNYMHPGTESGAVITFVAPAAGKISYEASAYVTGGQGVYMTVYVNDTLVFPAGGDLDEVLITKEKYTQAEPFEVFVSNLSVEEGDRVRLCVYTPDGKRNGRGTTLSKYPKVTYTECELPIGDPKGIAPSNVIPSRGGKDTADTHVVWDAVKNAVSYNVYVKDSKSTEDPIKVNAEPITGVEYKITNLEFNTLYEVTVTSVTKDGKESVPSDPVGFLTPKGSAATSDKTSDVTSDTNTNTVTNLPATGSNVGSNNNTGDTAGFPWIIVVIAAVVVVAIVVVLVLVLGKKKKVVAAPAAEEAAEIAAPAEAPAEESPAEEEKKDEE